jgi:hypothetical protein
MMRTGVCAALLLVVTGCGASSSSSSASVGCRAILLDRGQNVYANEIRGTRVGCATARRVAYEWGRQNVGAGDAHLPPGWLCSSRRPPCRRGRASVSFTLDYR